MSVSPTTHINPAASKITGAIQQAAQATGANFNYLLATAKVESNFNPGAKASTSSARGLFQFIEQTWLSTMKEAGPKLGYGQYANAITKTPSGRLEVSDPALRKEILNLRHDPAANAAMAGAFTRSNAALLASRLNRQPSEGELYIAHFLGASGAAKLIAGAAKSQTSAADMFPAAANANRSIFYDKQGNARTASEVYATLTGRYDVARARSVAPIDVAAASPGARKVAAAVPDTAGIANAFAASQPLPARAANAEPIFQALFHTSERRQAVAPKVSQLWSAPGSAAAPATGSPDTVTPRPSGGGTFDLFQDMPANMRSLFGT
ncbi:MAG: hypothetical protein QOJ96_1884 [Alphaproteobacteria bacterium]|jgi:hypothetical protein|nr:hypothetical protein [Alphaproteobacteria bacterium]